MIKAFASGVLAVSFDRDTLSSLSFFLLHDPRLALPVAVRLKPTNLVFRFLNVLVKSALVGDADLLLALLAHVFFLVLVLVTFVFIH